MASTRLSNRERFELELELHIRKARTCFKTYRRLINPKMKSGWFQDEICSALQTFFDDFVSGIRPKLVIEAPPQHGKSAIIVDFISWLAGRNPDWRTIYTSFSERLGIRANLRLQRIYDGEIYKRIFPETSINESNVVTISGQYLRNRTVLEYQGHDGYFRNTTVEGSITGESLDIGIIDDPIKGRKEANSITKRDSAWEWFTDDFFTRFSEDACLLCILTRWHIDDPIGRLIQKYPSTKVLKYRAIAEFDEKHRKTGEPLFPQHKSLEFLLERKSLLDTTSWLSLYQQSPIVEGGEIISGNWFGRWRELPPIKAVMIFVDTANKTKTANDYTVMQCWAHGTDGRIYLLDLIRGKWESQDLRQRMCDFYAKWKAKPVRKIMVEDAASGTGLIQELRKPPYSLPIFPITRTVDKYTRVMDVVAHIEIGNVLIPIDAPWVAEFIAECEAFTSDDSHANDDQIDPMCDAIKTFLQSTVRGFFT